MIWQNFVALFSVLAAPIFYLVLAVITAKVGIALTRYLRSLAKLNEEKTELLTRKAQSLSEMNDA